MKCPQCGNPMRTTNTWEPDTVRKRRQVCRQCKIVYTTSERIVDENILEKSEVVATYSNEPLKQD